MGEGFYLDINLPKNGKRHQAGGHPTHYGIVGTKVELNLPSNVNYSTV